MDQPEIEGEVEEGEGEVIDRLIEAFAKGEVNETGRKMVHWEIEAVSKRELSE